MQESKFEDIDILAVETAELYGELQLKVYCLEATHNLYGIEFLQCCKRSSLLANGYLKKMN